MWWIPALSGPSEHQISPAQPASFPGHHCAGLDGSIQLLAWLSDIMQLHLFEAVSRASVSVPRPEGTCADCGGLFKLATTRAEEDILA